MSNLKILALDPASTTGYCVADIINDVCEISDIGIICVDKKTGQEGDWCLDLMSKVDEIYKNNPFNEVCVEDFFFNRRFCNGANLNVYFRAAIYIWCSKNKIPYRIINIQSWKNFVLKGKPKKKIKGKKVNKKEEIISALKINWGLIMPEFSISATGRKVKFKHDSSDAIGQLMFFVNDSFNIDKFKIVTFIN